MDELGEELNSHLASSKSTFYHVMSADGDRRRLSLSVCSKGGEIECEVLMLPDFASPKQVSCDVTVDGEQAESREGVITATVLRLNQGYHALEFLTNSAAAAARVRLTGALSSSREAAV